MPVEYPIPDDLPPYDRDEALLDAALRTREPQLSIDRHPGVAVVLGHSGRPEVEVHAARVRADAVGLLRRRGGGCAVVLDPGNLLISMGLPLEGVGGITTAFAAISAWLAGSLAACGVPEVRQEGTSDLAVGDRKLGGSCVWRTRGLLYYATTLLVAPDLALLDRYLPHPPREPEYRRGRSHREFLTSITEIGGPPDIDAMRTALTAEATTRLDDLWRELAAEIGVFRGDTRC